LNASGIDIDGRRKRMGDILVEAGALTAEQLLTALHMQREQPQRRLGALLTELGYASEEAIARVLACQMRIPFLRIEAESLDETVVRLVSGRLARHHGCIPVGLADDVLLLAMANPFDLIAIEDIELTTGKRVDPVAAAESDIIQAIDFFYARD
jgi:type IV pilus assembly protein PilB